MESVLSSSIVGAFLAVLIGYVIYTVRDKFDKVDARFDKLEAILLNHAERISLNHAERLARIEAKLDIVPAVAPVTPPTEFVDPPEPAALTQTTSS
ncbi:MAG: hypothetical protein OXE93_02730 [bacterium]|nr:hypothetical protein [bacterium]